MFVAGVVAEYNPFHNGHKYQLEQTRRLGVDHVVVVMSGDAVQRGDTAVYSKYKRAQTAVRNGADLVVELPAPYSCSPAQVFAYNAVRLLAGFGEGVVNGISFGSSCDDAKVLVKAQEKAAALENDQYFKQLTSSGMSYPAALSAAAEKAFPEMKAILRDPNNVLGIEYISSAKTIAPWINPMCVRRKGAMHGDSAPSEGIASASLLREMLERGEDISTFVPISENAAPSFLKNADKAMLFRLLTCDDKQLESCPFVTQSFINRFHKAVEKCHQTVDELAQLIKSKDITMARVRRMLMHLTLGITHGDMAVPVPYGRILALNEKGAAILVAAKNRTINYDTSLARLERDDACKRTAFLECAAVKLREMSAGEPYSNEYTQKIVLTK